jgi:hypothetical protein
VRKWERCERRRVKEILLVYSGIINARDQSAVVSVVNDSIKGMFVSIKMVISIGIIVL